jgi:hypothetical protein
MTTLSYVLIAVSVLACGVVYGTDMFAAIVLRPALALVDDRTLVCTMGHVHDVADKRMPVPGVVGLMSAIAGTVVAAITGHLSATVAGVCAVSPLLIWLAIYVRVSAPINRQLAAASKTGQAQGHARDLQHQWDRVINVRSLLQMVAIAALCLMLILL